MGPGLGGEGGARSRLARYALVLTVAAEAVAGVVAEAVAEVVAEAVAEAAA